MSEPSKQNLSERLFAPRYTAKETSTLVKIADAGASLVHNPLDGDSETGWYRVLRRPQWIWQGIDPLEMESILSRMAISEADRSNDELIDTVLGFRPGNWAYEWTQSGMLHQRTAKLLKEKGERETAAEELLLASTYFSVAAYPHLKGDSLALQAELLANSAYRDAMELLPHTVKTIEVKFEGKTFQAFLHLPSTDKPMPTVMVSGGLETLQSDLWRLYQDYLGPAGLAMITLDMPSVGFSQRWPLTEDTSRLHQALLHELANVPWVDHHNVAMLGLRFGGNAAIRLGFLEPNRLKTCVSLGGMIHSMLTNPKVLDAMPRMYLDIIASRLGKNCVSKKSLLSHLQALSLKQQGLLGRRKVNVPMLGVRLNNDPVCSEFDNELIKISSYGGKAVTLPEKPLFDGYHRSLLTVTQWLKEKLIE